MEKNMVLLKEQKKVQMQGCRIQFTLNMHSSVFIHVAICLNYVFSYMVIKI